MRLIGLSLACVLALAWVSEAALWRVPDSAPTIQAAIDSSSQDDTVLVAPGVYSESLLNTQFRIHLIGAASPFGESPVIIDPSNLPNAQDITCITTNAPMWIDSISFRNGAAMYPRGPGNQSGGVLLHATNCRIAYCQFDSVYNSVVSFDNIEIYDTDFFECINLCVGTTPDASVRAERCSFSGSGIALVQSRGGATIRNCVFSDLGLRHFLNFDGDVLLVEENHFGPSVPGSFYKFQFSNCSGSFADNILEACHNNAGIIYVIPDCDADFLISRNLIQDVAASNYTIGVDVSCPDNCRLTIEDNTLLNANFSAVAGKAITVYSGTFTAKRNRFINLLPLDEPVIYSEDSGSLVKENVFIGNGFGIYSEDELDARNNFWGDSTGPYNALHNPSGLGDSVSNQVLFDPWFADTSFLVEEAFPRIDVPSEFGLTVYPNPFNSAARISLEVPNAFIASVELLNVLGQQVREIHRGPVYGHEEFALDARALPSGIYFVRIRDVVRNSTNFSQKIALIR